MRFALRALPAAGGGALTRLPVVDIALEGLPDAPMECLLDTGALRTRMSAELTDTSKAPRSARPRQPAAPQRASRQIMILNGCAGVAPSSARRQTAQLDDDRLTPEFLDLLAPALRRALWRSARRTN